MTIAGVTKVKKYCGVISRKCSSDFSQECHENASAELIGSIIIIGLFVAAFGIVLMALLSSSSDFVVPAVVIEPQPITEWNGTYVLDLRAGDTLLRDETRIIVDGRDRTADFVEDPSYDPGGAGWQEWGVGDSLYLEYSGSEAPNAVQVIYSGLDGGGILLWEQGTTENRLPVAAFSANATQGYSPLTVSFTDASSNNPTSWLWSFGDGETSSLHHPVHTYTSPGYYTVRLTVTNLYDQDTLVKSGYIHVSGGFTVNFVGTPHSGTAPLTVNFTDLTTGAPVSWLWDFGDGVTSTLRNPEHTYAASGQYVVSLTVATVNESGTEVKDEYISVGGTPPAGDPPEVTFTASPLTGDAPLEVQFTSTVTGAAPLTYLWSFGDGTTSADANPLHTYANAGTYDVSLTVTNDYGNDNSTISGYVVVSSAPNLKNAELITDPSKPGTIENGGTFTFTVDGLYSSITIGGGVVNLNSGDLVEIRVVDGSEANLYMTSTAISSFTISDARLLVNGAESGDGPITNAWISSYNGFVSNADLIVPKKNVWTRLTVDGTDVINGKDNQVITLFSIQPASSGIMNLYLDGSEVYFLGGIDSYQLL